MIATIMLQIFSPVTPVEPMRSKMKPPTSAPTIPSAMLSQNPCPCLSTILLPMNPAIRPNMIQLMIPMDYLPLYDVTIGRRRARVPTWSLHVVDDKPSLTFPVEGASRSQRCPFDTIEPTCTEHKQSLIELG